MPTHSSWTQIREAAEILEITENVGSSEGKERSSKVQKASSLAGASGIGSSSSGLGHHPGRGTNQQMRRFMKGHSGGPGIDSGWAQLFSAATVPRPRRQIDKLNKTEKAKLSAEGKCYECHEVRQKGKPPGVTSFNIEFNWDEAENLKTLSESTTCSGTITSANLEFNYMGLPTVADLESLSTDYSAFSMADACQFLSELGSSKSCKEDVGQLEYTTPTDNYDDLPELLSGSEGDSGDEDGGSVFGNVDQDKEESVSIADRLELPATCHEGRGYTSIGDLDEWWAVDLLKQYALYCCTQLENGPLFMPDYFYLVGDVDPTQSLLISDYFPEGLAISNERLCDVSFDLPSWFRQEVAWAHGHSHCYHMLGGAPLGDTLEWGVSMILNNGISTPLTGHTLREPRFSAMRWEDVVIVEDHYLDLVVVLPTLGLTNPMLDLVNAYAKAVRHHFRESGDMYNSLEGALESLFYQNSVEQAGEFLELNYAKPTGETHDSFLAVQCNAGTPKDFKPLIPEPIVVVVHINGHPARALLDSEFRVG
ncbi:hypothetical protein WOLCODRAFT_15019 [Wolfiporia cocos MD-104 SS10]|uniref:Uncharacterized protein n=1 Tax=Wolfiporia cocos (strain MD-104) TaxID=742152 RepID=A0A2H3IVG2_WOLCO|nr:hypothetical protein WOLCODRAFT_15019 [Wolfiporia cocos MD-104 SS10]